MVGSELLTVQMLGMPLMFVVIGMVTWMRKMGVRGRWLLVSSLVWGVVIGVGYQLAQLGVHLSYGIWFAVVVYGLGLGLLASLFYDMLKGVIERSLGRLLDAFERES